MRILITGSSGFVGSRLIPKLEGHELFLMDARAGGNMLFRALPPDIDVVYHLAAHKSVEESWHDPILYAENIEMIQRLVHTYPDAKIIHASSCASEHPNTSPYAFFKWAGSAYLRGFHKNYVDLIFPNIFGGQQKQNSVVDIFKAATEIEVHSPKTTRDYVHVEDIADALVLAKDWDTGVYELGSGVQVSTLEIAEMTGKPFKVTEPRSGGKEPLNSEVKNTTPNWTPKISLKDYVTDN